MTTSPTLRLGRRGLGILGGTFDPVHIGHLCLARAALAEIPLVRVELMPAGVPWQKSGISSGMHRLNMLKLAVEYEPLFRINTMELCRSGPTYTIETVAALRDEVGPAMPLVLILGSDQWLNLSTWKNWERLTDYVHIAYCSRDGTPDQTLPEAQAAWAAPRITTPRQLTMTAAGRITRFNMAPHRANATQIRRTLGRLPYAQAMKTLDGWLHPGVAQYIRLHGLYGAVPH